MVLGFFLKEPEFSLSVAGGWSQAGGVPAPIHLQLNLNVIFFQMSAVFKKLIIKMSLK